MLTTAPPHWFWFILSLVLLLGVSPLTMGAAETLLRLIQTVRSLRAQTETKRFF